MYLTRQELIDRFGEREIMRLEANINDPQATDTAITDASNDVDGYIARQHQLPLPVVTKSIQRAVAVIARYYLYKDRPTKEVRQDYEDVIAWLDKVASGKVLLVFGTDSMQTDETKQFVSGAFVA